MPEDPLAMSREEQESVYGGPLPPGLELRRLPPPMPDTVDFTYYLHDDAEGSERIDALRRTLSAPIPMDDDELGQLFGRPFYEVTLNCTLDLTTGNVTVNSVKL